MPVHELSEFGETNDQPIGKFTIRVSAVPTVIKVAVTTIGVAFVPVTPISEVEVAVAFVIVAALAGATAKPSAKPIVDTTLRAALLVFTMFPHGKLNLIVDNVLYIRFFGYVKCSGRI